MVPLAAVCEMVRASAGAARPQAAHVDPPRGVTAQLMIEDGKMDSQEGGAAPRAAVSVAEDLEALRGRVRGVVVEEEGENPEAECAGDAKGVPKQEAGGKRRAKAEAKSKAKGKAKAKTKTVQKGGMLKRPAKKTPPRELGAAERSAKREALLQRVPAALKRRFAGGCSTCRFRPMCTVSCWAKRGFVA